MARYVEVSQIVRELLSVSVTDDLYGMGIHSGIDKALKIIQEAPSADVVEIVRCEKCKYGDVSIISKAKDGEEDIACYCTLKKVVTNIDSYCPSGRRRNT